MYISPKKISTSFDCEVFGLLIWKFFWGIELDEFTDGPQSMLVRLKVSLQWCNSNTLGFPGGSVVKNPSANAGDTGDGSSIPELGRSPGEGSGNPLQCSCLENPMTEETGRSQRVGRDLAIEQEHMQKRKSASDFEFWSFVRLLTCSMMLR